MRAAQDKLLDGGDLFLVRVKSVRYPSQFIL